MAAGDAARFSAFDILRVAAACLLLAICIVRFARGFCQTVKILAREFLFEVSRLLRRATEADGGTIDAEEKKLDNQVNVELEKQRSDYFVLAASVWSGCMLMAVGTRTLNMALQFQDQWLTPVADWFVFGFFAVVLLVSFFPRLACGVFRDLTYSMLMFLACGVMASIEHGFVRAQSLIFSARLCLSLAHGRLVLVVIWNTLFMCTSRYTEKQHLASDLRTNLTSDLISWFTIVGAVSVASSILRGRVKDRLTVLTVTNERSVMRRLLDLMCDATIELDSALKFSDHFPQFAGMLMLRKDKDVKGTPITAYVDAEDADIIKEQMLGSGQDTAPASASAVHAVFRGSMDTKVNCEIFFVPYKDSGGAKRLMVGLRETGERDIAELQEFRTRARKKKKSSSSSSRASAGESVDPAPVTLGLGTAPVLRASPLVANGATSSASRNSEGSSSGSSSGSSRSSRSSRSADRQALGPVYPHLPVTCKHARQLTVLMAMKSWNLEVRMRTCCRFHAAVMELRKICKELEAAECHSHFKAYGAYHCPHCGTLQDTQTRHLICPACKEYELQASTLQL